MPVPTSYTDATFKAYLHSALDGIADVLSYTVIAGSYDEILNDVLIALGQTDITTITDMRGLRATGRYYAWKRAADKAATLYDFSVDKRSFKRNQMAEYIYKNLSMAEADPYATIGSNDAAGIVVIPLNFNQDPYSRNRNSSFNDRPYDDD